MTSMKSYLHRILFLLVPVLCLALSSCEKVIDLDLNTTDPHVVIDGNITDQPGPYTVNVTQTTKYLTDQPSPGVSGAKVIISDNTGITDTLKEQIPGVYVTTHIQGKVGNTYFLSVTTDSKTYTAQSTMPSVNHIDSLTYKYRNDPPLYRDAYYSTIHVRESPEPNQYYRFKIYRNDTLFNRPQDITVTNDQLVNGKYINFDIRYRYKLGDKVGAEIDGITEDEFNYWTALQQQLNSSGLFDPPRSNPVTNITNGGLGFFSAHSVTSMSVVIH